MSEGARIRQQRCDVLEDDARFRVVRDISDETGELDHGVCLTRYDEGVRDDTITFNWTASDAVDASARRARSQRVFQRVERAGAPRRYELDVPGRKVTYPTRKPERAGLLAHEPAVPDTLYTPCNLETLGRHPFWLSMRKQCRKHCGEGRFLG